MKTENKLAKELYPDYVHKSEGMQTIVRSLNQMNIIKRTAFCEGYNEAMRWRDPNIELPDYYKKVIVKYERDDSKIDYACVSRLADDEGDYFFGDYHFDIVIDFNRVIGWRPIE